MSKIIHKAIVVTASVFLPDGLANIHAARKQAETLSLSPSAICHSPINGFVSFFVPPDGGKQGTDVAEKSDGYRSQFKSWLNAAGDSLEWGELSYGIDAKEVA